MAVAVASAVAVAIGVPISLRFCRETIAVCHDMRRAGQVEAARQALLAVAPGLAAGRLHICVDRLQGRLRALPPSVAVWPRLASDATPGCSPIMCKLQLACIALQVVGSLQLPGRLSWQPGRQDLLSPGRCKQAHIAAHPPTWLRVAERISKGLSSARMAVRAACLADRASCSGSTQALRSWPSLSTCISGVPAVNVHARALRRHAIHTQRRAWKAGLQ